MIEKHVPCFFCQTIFWDKQTADEVMFFVEDLQLLKAKGMMESKNGPFTSPNEETMNLDNNHQ